jgi:excisionase family DNA binding protein
VADILDRRLGLGKIRKKVRGQDAELDSVLMALGMAGLAFRTGQEQQFALRSGIGTEDAKPAEPPSHSDVVGTRTAAGLLGITDRAVRKAIAEGRLPATTVDGRHRIHREDIENYRATRTRAA